MRPIAETVTRGIAFYRKHGFWGFVEAVFAYLWNEYQLKRYQHPLSLRSRASGQGRRIFYIDYFSTENSNFYWLKAFQEFGKVKTFDIVRDDRELLREGIMNFEPDHIHLGASVKNSMVPPQLLPHIKKELNCTISVFYGDSPYSPYHSELAKVVDCIYVSNKTHIKTNAQRGLKSFKYMPCPTDPDIFNHQDCKKVYDLVFIANNNQASRLPLLRKLHSLFALKVFGNGWEGTGLDYGNSVYGKKFSRACNQAKICIGILDPVWTDLEAYFSNRLVNTLATGSLFIQPYTPGLENVFTNRKHLVWYNNEEELFQLIGYYLDNEMEREEIAIEGQKEVYRKYTYTASVRRILQDVGLGKAMT